MKSCQENFLHNKRTLLTTGVIKFLTMDGKQSHHAKDFARWMAAQRAALGITLDNLEERTGIKKQHLSTLERAVVHSLTGKPVIPKRATIEKIAKGLEASVEIALQVAGYATPDAVQPVTLQEFCSVNFNIGHHLNAEQWEIVEAILKNMVRLAAIPQNTAVTNARRNEEEHRVPSPLLSEKIPTK